MTTRAVGGLSGSAQLSFPLPNMMTITPQVNGSYSTFVIRYCVQGSTYDKKRGSVVWDMTKPLLVPPNCIEVDWGYYGELQSSYTVQLPDVRALYGLESLYYTMYFEVRVPVSTGSKVYLLDSKQFKVVAP